MEPCRCAWVYDPWVQKLFRAPMDCTLHPERPEHDAEVPPCCW